MIEIIPLLILFIIYPIVVKMNVFPTPRGSFEYLVHPLGDANGDFYFFEKLKLLLPMALILLIIFLFKKKKLQTKYYLGLGIYIVGISASTFLSPFFSIAVKGGGNRYEGYYVLLAYGVLTLIALNISMEDIKKARILVYSLFAGGFLVSIVGITEFFGTSIYKLPILSNYILSNDELVSKATSPSGGYISLIQVIKENPQFHNVSASLGNSNYGGSFCALVLGVLVVLFLENKKILNKVVLSLVYIGIFSLLLTSRSRAGMVAFQSGIIFLTILKVKSIKKYLPSILVLIILTAGSFFSMDYFSGGGIGDKLSDFEGAKKSEMRELIVDGNLLKLNMYSDDLYIENIGNGLRYLDTNKKKIISEEVGNRINFKDDRYIKFSIVKDEKYTNIVYLEYEGRGRYPLVLLNSTFKTIGREGQMEDIISPSRIAELDKIQTKGSSRVYIWSRSIPLLKKSRLFGYGPDTFPIIYPQNDYFGKFIAYGTPYMFISKPHNMYLQMAINTGILSLLGFLMIIIPYFLQSLKIQWSKTELDEREVIALGTFVGIVNYLIAGLFNDSAVSIAPNFWMLLGLGIALNTYIIKDRKEKNIEKMKKRI